MSTWTGGCACGAVRYAIEGEPMVMTDCQCLDCQKESGTGHASHLVFAREGAVLTGETAGWDMRADGGDIKTAVLSPVRIARVHDLRRHAGDFHRPRGQPGRT